MKWGRVLRFLGVAFLGAFVALFTLYIQIARSLPDLQPWHSGQLVDDFDSWDSETFEAYLEREAEVFADLEEQVAASSLSSPQSIERFEKASPTNPFRHPTNWNRTFVFEPKEPRGGALLVHGLTDSPYSLRSVGEILRDRGFYVVGLRVPGHGTTPGELAQTKWRDWEAAVRVAARQVGERVGSGLPFFMVGYSNGAALGTAYTLRALLEGDDPVPTQLVLFSAALSVSRVASLASFQRRLSAIPGLKKLAWTAIQPEFDPYKYNSFPVVAGEQIHRLTSKLGAALERAHAREELRDFPPVLAFQSAVDATIPALSVADQLLSRLPKGRGELVMFDVNRLAEAEELMSRDPAGELNDLVRDPSRAFTVTVISNRDPNTTRIVSRRHAPVETKFVEHSLGQRWPSGIFSLSHVALPFRVEDPIYGLGGDSDDPMNLQLGGIEVRGERGLLGVPMDQLMRLRYNPFFPYVEERLFEVVEAASSR